MENKTDIRVSDTPRITIKGVLSLSWYEYKKWLFSPKMILLPILFVFIHSYMIIPLRDHAALYGEKIGCFEPFLGVINSNLLLLIVPALYLVLLSSHPVLRGELYSLLPRCGRIRWMLAQILFLFFAACSIFLFILIFTTLFSGGEIRFAWSNTITKFASRYPRNSQDLISLLYPSGLYNQFYLIPAILHSLSLNLAYLMILSLTMCLCSILGQKKAGYLISVFLIAAGYITSAMNKSFMWLLPQAHITLLKHYKDVLAEPLFPVWLSHILLWGIVSILFGILLIVVRKIDFWGEIT